MVATILTSESIAAGEFKAKCLHLLDEVSQNRKPIIITKRGKPVARLMPIDEPVPQVFGRLKDTAVILGDIVAPTGETWDAER